MRPLSLIQYPPVMILGIALCLVPSFTGGGTHHYNRQIGFWSNFQIEPSVSTWSPYHDVKSISGSTHTNALQDRQTEVSNGSVSPRIALNFQLNSLRNPLSIFNFSAPAPQHVSSYDLDGLFEGNSHSLVAAAVGSAEGTRTPAGGYTSAFQGHTDPGNGVWNLGTFSYQHGAASPEEADSKQLNRLKRQATQIRQRAARAEIILGLEEELNGIDLANQSPLAALGEPGYAEWLAEAYRRGLQGQEAILWARVQGYWDVRRGRWNAPGLGNTEPLIRRDQNRRMQAIAQAVEYRTASANQNLQPPASAQSNTLNMSPNRSPEEELETNSENSTANILLNF